LDVQVHGSDELQEKLRLLLFKHRKVFSHILPAQPATLTPLHFEVNIEEWNVSNNKHPARKQSMQKDAEVESMIGEMENIGIIKPAPDAIAWSQVLLALKPNGKWRFCIDFRALNKCMITDKSWPLPRIPEIIQDVGHEKPIVFAKMDMVNGYHQINLEESCKLLTAFRTRSGIYQYNRAPISLKPSGSQFQHVMQNEVVCGEKAHVYLDDLLELLGKLVYWYTTTSYEE
jgi:hypothetical protein